MSHLDIEVLDTTGGYRLQGAVVPAEIIDVGSGSLVMEVGIEIGEVNRVEVPAGDYTVRVRFPGGRLIQVGAADGTTVKLPAPPSKHEWLSWETAAGEAPPREGYGEHLRRPAGETPWVQLWTTEPHPWPDAYSETDLITWKVTLREPLPPGMHYALVGSATAATRVIVLPVESPASITLRPVEPDLSHARGMAVTASIATDRATVHDRRVDSVLRYLTRGEVETSQLVAAERLLFEKLMDPTGAAIGGYYLLQAGEYERLHYWPGNFERWKDYLPDAAIIHGLQMLWDPQVRDEAAAAHSLLRATLLGPPLLSMGLRLLRRGLHYLSRRSGDAAVDAARRIVTSYAAAVDWTEPFTTFWASSPAAPDTASGPGIPGPRAHMEWLSRREGLYDFPDPDSVTVMVEPGPEGDWLVRRTGPDGDTARSVPTKREAVVSARSVLPTSPSARLIVLRADGTVERVLA